MSQQQQTHSDLSVKTTTLGQALNQMPCTPEPLHEQHEEFQPFAHLVPINRAARLAFDSAVDAINASPEIFARARRNMQFEAVRQESLSAASVFTDSDATETEIRSGEPIYRFQGRFHFNLGHPPRNPKVGWVLGEDQRPTMWTSCWLVPNKPRLWQAYMQRSSRMSVHAV